jgi:hypothetical protein
VEKKEEGFSLLTLVLTGVGTFGLGFLGGYVVRDSQDEATAAKKTG